MTKTKSHKLLITCIIPVNRARIHSLFTKLILVALFYLTAFASSAQKIKLPKHVTSVEDLHTAIPVIAKEIIQLYKEEKSTTYWDDIFRIQLAAGLYRQSLASIDSLIDIYKNDTWEGNAAIGIQFRSYALTKLSQPTSGKSFTVLFKDTLSALYYRLPAEAKPVVESFFSSDTISLKKKLSDQLSSSRENDSMSLTEAKTLVRTYNTYNVMAQVLALAKQFLSEEDNKNYIIQDSLLITGHHGSLLSAVIYRKREIKIPLPVVLVYNIYAGPRDKSIAKTAADKNFAGMVVNTRGKFLSHDNLLPFEHDAKDSYAVLDWISKQPWCNGKVGMYGGSYLGFSQWSAAKKIHPVLKTIVPQVAVAPGTDYPMLNGVYMSYMLRWIHYVSNNKLTDQTEFNDRQKWDSLEVKWYRSGRAFQSLDTLEGRPNAIFQSWLKHPTYDRFWQSMIPHAGEFANINIPILTTTGYFDSDQRGAFYYYNQHHQWNKNANHYLLIGPYDHGGAQSAAIPQLMGYTIDSVANINVNETVWQWFNYILKDSARPTRLKDKVNYQVMGTNEWRSAPGINAIARDSIVFYLSHVYTREGYKLESEPLPAKAYISQEVSYTDRELLNLADPTIIDSTIFIGDGLKFISPPLEKDIIMTGSLQGEINAILNKKDIDLKIDCYELMANGKYFSLSNTIQRASFIKDPAKRSLLNPGKEVSMQVYNSIFTSKKILKGSRIVLVIGMNKSHWWQVNYGTGKDVSTETIEDGTTPLRIQWSNRSYIKLPLERL